MQARKDVSHSTNSAGIDFISVGIEGISQRKSRGLSRHPKYTCYTVIASVMVMSQTAAVSSLSS